MAKSKIKKSSGYKHKAPFAPVPSPPETPVPPTALSYPAEEATLPSPEETAETLPYPAAEATIPSPAHINLTEDNLAPPSLKNI